MTTEPLLFFSGYVRWLPCGIPTSLVRGYSCMGSLVGGWPSWLWATLWWASLWMGPTGGGLPCRWLPLLMGSPWLSFILGGLPCRYSYIPLFSPRTHIHIFFFSVVHIETITLLPYTDCKPGTILFSNELGHISETFKIISIYSLRISYKQTVPIDHIHPPSSLLNFSWTPQYIFLPVLWPLPPQFLNMSLDPIATVRDNVSTRFSWMWGHQLEHGKSTCDHTPQKKNDSPSLSINQLSVVFWWGVCSCESLSHPRTMFSSCSPCQSSQFHSFSSDDRLRDWSMGQIKGWRNKVNSQRLYKKKNEANANTHTKIWITFQGMQSPLLWPGLRERTGEENVFFWDISERRVWVKKVWIC